MRSLPLLAAVAGCALLTACAAGGGLTPQAATIANTVITDGQLFCAFANGPAAGAVVAVVNAADKSAVTVTGWPSRISASCTSLKLASIQTLLSGTTAINGVPAPTCWPTCTVRWAITPSTGATSRI